MTVPLVTVTSDPSVVIETSPLLIVTGGGVPHWSTISALQLIVNVFALISKSSSHELPTPSLTPADAPDSVRRKVVKLKEVENYIIK